MWAPSKETQDALVWKDDVEREPQLYPKELVTALSQIDNIEKEKEGASYDPKFIFSVKGFIIRDFGVVGVRPDAPEIAKREWMEHWEALKAEPYAML